MLLHIALLIGVLFMMMGTGVATSILIYVQLAYLAKNCRLLLLCTRVLCWLRTDLLAFQVYGTSMDGILGSHYRSHLISEIHPCLFDAADDDPLSISLQTLILVSLLNLSLQNSFTGFISFNRDFRVSQFYSIIIIIIYYCMRKQLFCSKL